MSGKNRKKLRRYDNPANHKPLPGGLKKLVQPTGNADPLLGLREAIDSALAAGIDDEQADA